MARKYVWKVEYAPTQWGGAYLEVQVKDAHSWGEYPITFYWERTAPASDWYLSYQQTRTVWTPDMKDMSAFCVRLSGGAMRPHPVAVIQKLERMSSATRVQFDPRLNGEVPVSEIAPAGWGAWCEDISALEAPEDESQSWYAYCRVMAPDEERARRMVVAELADRLPDREYRMAFLKAGEPVTCFSETEPPEVLYLPDIIYDHGMVEAWVRGEETIPTVGQAIEHFQFRSVPEWLVELMLEIEQDD